MEAFPECRNREVLRKKMEAFPECRNRYIARSIQRRLEKRSISELPERFSGDEAVGKDCKKGIMWLESQFCTASTNSELRTLAAPLNSISKTECHTFKQQSGQQEFAKPHSRAGVSSNCSEKKTLHVVKFVHKVDFRITQTRPAETCKLEDFVKVAGIVNCFVWVRNHYQDFLILIRFGKFEYKEMSLVTKYCSRSSQLRTCTSLCAETRGRIDMRTSDPTLLLQDLSQSRKGGPPQANAGLMDTRSGRPKLSFR
jgi:hypothetical protein